MSTQSDSLSVVVADDDPAQLSFLAGLVRRMRPEWRIVAEATTAQQVRDSLSLHRPSLAILDVQFAGATAIEIVSGLRETVPVIFVTGDAAHAAEAFACDALDFVLKPVKAERFESALRKAEASAQNRNPGLEAGRQVAGSLCVYKGSDLIWTRVADVIYFEAQRKYTRVVTAETEGLLKMGISTTQQYLDPRLFWRIHRGTIVNIAHMSAARRDELGRITIRFKHRNERLQVSRPYEHLFRDGFA